MPGVHALDIISVENINKATASVSMLRSDIEKRESYEISVGISKLIFSLFVRVVRDRFPEECSADGV